MSKRSVLETIGNTPLVELPKFSPSSGVRLFGKLESHNPTGSLKDRIANAMLIRAEEDGLLVPNRIVLESTSGNTGISLAMAALLRGYRFHAVLPENASPERVHLLNIYGATISYSPAELGSSGSVEVAQQMAASDHRYTLMFQYGNPANPAMHYATTGEEIVRDLPGVTHFVAALGSGGTLMGAGQRLKDHNPRVTIVCVLPQLGDQIPGMRNPMDGFIPPVFDGSLMDEWIEVSRAESERVTVELMSREALFMGLSSGAVVLAAMKLAERVHSGNVVCLLSDDGWRYLSTGIWDSLVPVVA